MVDTEGVPTSEPSQEECPLNRDSLGYYSWSLLHTFAAYYPENPTEKEQGHMKGFLEGFR